MTRSMLTGRGLTLTLLLCGFTTATAGQLRPGARRTLRANPPTSVTVGNAVVLSVQGAPQGASYRYVATLTADVAGQRPDSRCPRTQNIASGTSATWQPTSGRYRLTAYGPTGQSETDTLSMSYEVRARPAMLASSQTSAGDGAVHLVLRSDDLGPGHVYLWWMQYRGNAVPSGGGTAAPPPIQTWTNQTSGPMATYPTPIPPPSSISATVRIHRGDPCAIIAAGSMGLGE